MTAGRGRPDLGNRGENLLAATGFRPISLRRIGLTNEGLTGPVN